MLYEDILSLSLTLAVSLLLTTEGPPLPSRPDNVGRLNCKNLFPSEYHYSHLSKLCNISQEFARKPFLIFAGKTLSLPVFVGLLHRSQGCLRLLLIWATTEESVETTLDTTGPHSGPHTLLNIFCHWNIIAHSPHTKRRRQNISWRLNTSSSSSTPRQSTTLSCVIILDSLEL